MSENVNNNFIGGITRKFSVTIDKIYHHPYLLSSDNKQLTRQNLKVFVCEQYHIISNDKRNFALIQQRTSNSVSADLFKECISIEHSALSNLSLLQNELDIDILQLKSYEPLAGCQAYTNYLTRLCSYGSDAEVFAAILTDLPFWGENCKRISTALKKKYRFPNDSCRFLEGFASPLPEEFLKGSNKVIKSSLPTYRKEMETAARFILDYELMFWDTIYSYSMLNQNFLE
jgi:thiaminase